MAQDLLLFFIGQSVICCSTKKSCAHRGVAALLDWQAWTVVDKACKLECLTQIQIRSVKIMFVVWIAIMVGVSCLEGISCSDYTAIPDADCFPIRCPDCSFVFIFDRGATFRSLLFPLCDRSDCRLSIRLLFPRPFSRPCRLPLNRWASFLAATFLVSNTITGSRCRLNSSDLRSTRFIANLRRAAI
jgi:hypothetical protein